MSTTQMRNGQVRAIAITTQHVNSDLTRSINKEVGQEEPPRALMEEKEEWMKNSDNPPRKMIHIGTKRKGILDKRIIP